MTSVESEATATDTAQRPRVRDVAGAYIGLTKPRVVELLLLTTVPVMFAAQRGVPPLGLVIATVVGGTLSAGAANSLNCVYDRDIDEQMRRTRRRALPRHMVSPRNALIFGLTLMVGSTLLLGFAVNWLSSGLALAASAFYLLIYTMILKRRTTQNIVWGGAAGCMPVVIGWAAVTGRVEWPALVMFGVIFFWTPPHFWALAMRYRDDYAAAGVPMLPVVATPVQVSRRIVVYAWVMAVWSLLLVPATSWIYAVVAVALGGYFLFRAHRLHAGVVAGREVVPMKLFHLSNMYLCGLFAAIAVDAAVGLPVLGAVPF